MLAIEEGPVRALLLDIEGTTTPADFVYKVLFPYVSGKLEEFIRGHRQDAEIRSQIEALKAQRKADEDQGLRPPAFQGDSEAAQLASLVAYGQWLISRDSKSTPLKAIQGKIWQEGYESGDLQGEVYADVPQAFARWRRQGKDICIYSSGSALAQQLLFRSTAAGDLISYLREYFDTRIGPKTDSASYKKIAASLGYAAREILFLSDAAKELDAARTAGMRTALCVRSGDQADDSTGHPVIRTFDEVFPER